VPRPALSESDLAKLGLNLVRGEVIQRCELLEGHGFRAYNVWNELVRG
jgi:hypothetical protein